MLPAAALKLAVLKEMVEDVHLGGVAVDAVNQHIYWTAAWRHAGQMADAPGTWWIYDDLCGSGDSTVVKMDKSIYLHIRITILVRFRRGATLKIR